MKNRQSFCSLLKHALNPVSISQTPFSQLLILATHTGDMQLSTPVHSDLAVV